MTHRPHSLQSTNYDVFPHSEDYLSPEEREALLADILSTIAVRLIKKEIHESQARNL